MMDTAKVDIRKLQLLNDRINQCIDALNQVRLSVHGLSHSSQPSLGNPAAIPGIGLPQQQPQPGVFGQAYPGLQQLGQMPGVAPGFSHTSAFGGSATSFGQGALGALQVPFAAGNPYGNPYSGLSHTSGESLEAFARPVWADPILQARIAQTFPYAYVAVPPVVTIY